jgi:hypothetical protein
MWLPLAVCKSQRALWHFDKDSWIFPFIKKFSKSKISYKDSIRFLPTICICVAVIAVLFSTWDWHEKEIQNINKTYDTFYFASNQILLGTAILRIGALRALWNDKSYAKYCEIFKHLKTHTCKSQRNVHKIYRGAINIQSCIVAMTKLKRTNNMQDLRFSQWWLWRVLSSWI